MYKHFSDLYVMYRVQHVHAYYVPRDFNIIPHMYMYNACTCTMYMYNACTCTMYMYNACTCTMYMYNECACSAEPSTEV